MNPSTQKQNKILPVIAILSVIGAIISAWQTHQFFTTRSGFAEMNSFCNINATFDCTTVEMSKFAELLPGLPLSEFAIAGYVLILLLALFGFVDSMKTHIRKFLVIFTGIALLFSVAYLLIMMTQIGKWCLFCLIVDTLNTLLFVAALMLPKPANASANGGPHFSHIAGAGVAALLVAFLLGKGLDPQAQVRSEDLNDMVESVMSAPVRQINIPADAPFVGKADAPITIVKFSDYQCPSCKMGAQAIHPLMKRYENQVKFVFVNYPLDQACNSEVKRQMHEFACEAARVAVCAAEQGKFLETYETLFEHQKDLAEGKIADLLSGIPGLNIAQVKACMPQPSTQEKIKNDVALGAQMKIEATPTFFINGKKVEGGLPTSLWIEVIERMLKK